MWWEKWVVVEKPVNPMDGLRVECVGNRHDNIGPSFYFVYVTNKQYVHVTKIERDDLK